MTKYYVYTDAATRHNNGVSSISFLVLSEDIVLHTHSDYCAYKNTAHAESIALGDALKYVAENIDSTDDDVIEINCDSLYAVKYARIYRSSSKKGDDSYEDMRPTKALWLYNIYDSIPKIKGKIKFIKIKGHGIDLNPHTYVDRLAKIGLTVNKSK